MARHPGNVRSVARGEKERELISPVHTLPLALGLIWSFVDKHCRWQRPKWPTHGWIGDYGRSRSRPRS